ncbi:hypothetical protein BJF78_32280 [Pseudonocardia sp. CNS-139]|nr:hypothetical protein BJF78_32280 [Pseudonocardia sp. CNS-139]
MDGQEWWRTTDTSILPPRPMHLCIQLDWFPEGGPVQPSAMFVDWVRYYPLVPLPAAAGTAPAGTGAVPAALLSATPARLRILRS